MTSTVLITGASAGIGLAFARQYAARGWNVIATARTLTADLRAITDLTLERLDVTSEADIAALAEKYRGRPIDLLINNAGILGLREDQKLGHLKYATFAEVMAINAFGAVAVTQAFAENVAASATKKIVAISSGIASPATASPGLHYLRASKAALNVMMRTIAAELRDRGVIVGLLAPGLVATKLLAAAGHPGTGAMSPDDSVTGLIKVIDGLTLESARQMWNYAGETVPW